MQLSPEQQRAIDEQKTHCPFCKMVRREIPVKPVFEDDDFIAILDINPGVTGHTLLIPKEHYPILPLAPKRIQDKLATHLAAIGAGLKRALVTANVETFIANGAVAGQQTSHFLVHLLPAERQHFHVPAGTGERTTAVRAALQQRFGTPATSTSKDALSEAISNHPELKRMILEQPDELIANLSAAPDLAKLFQGVDIKKLSEKLREQETPVATALSDEQLRQFINSKEHLRELLVDDPASLDEAMRKNPRLGKFFSGSSVAHVRERYLGGGS